MAACGVAIQPGGKEREINTQTQEKPKWTGEKVSEKEVNKISTSSTTEKIKRIK